MIVRKAMRVATVLILSVIADYAMAGGAWIADANGCKMWDVSPKPNESVSWSGACANGYAEGPGTQEWTVDGVKAYVFEGKLFAGKLNGQGKTTNAKGGSYEGNFVDGLPQGKGITIFADGARYEGDFALGKPTGKGVYTWGNGTSYAGDISDGRPNGKGVMKFPSGDNYEGDFVDGKRTGKGSYSWASGDRYEGDFVDGKLEGSGVTTFANGDRYKGSYSNGKFEGRGVMTYAKSNKVQYEGYWKAGEYDGLGILIERPNPPQMGEFQAGKFVRSRKVVANGPAYVDIQFCAPRYSKAALDAKEEGTVRVKFEIAADGRLSSLSIVNSSGFADLDQATAAALSRCTVYAEIKDGRPIASTLVMDYAWKPIPPKVPEIVAHLKDDEGVLVIDFLIVEVKSLDHPEQIVKRNGQEAHDTQIRNLTTRKKYDAMYKSGIGVFVVPEGNYCLDSFTTYTKVDGRAGESYPHWCKGESIAVKKGIINNAGEWWFAQQGGTDDDLFHSHSILIGEYENGPRLLQRTVNLYPALFAE